MSLKDLLGEDYKEGMTVEEIEAFFDGKEFVDKDSLGKMVRKGLFDEKLSELASHKKRANELEKQMKELENAQLTEEELLKQKLAEAEEARKELEVERNRVKAQSLFVEAGITSDEAETLIGLTVSHDSEQTIQKTNELIAVMQSKIEVAQNQTKEELLKGGVIRPKPGQKTEPGMTKEKFKELKYKERVHLLETDPDLYAKMTES